MRTSVCHAQLLSRGRRWPRLAASEAGFTMIEMLISALLVVLIGAAVAQALIADAHVSADQRRHALADQLAQQDQERLKGMSAKQLFGLDQTWSVVVDGTTFNGESTAAFLNASGGSTCSPAGTGAASYYSVVSQITWTSNARTPVKEESVITPPAGGALVVQVKDQAGAPLSGVTATASGPDYESASTDASGCAIFGGLPTGEYTVTLSKLNYVDPTGDSTPSGIAEVTGTGTSVPTGNPFTMGLVGSLAANFTAVVNTGTVPTTALVTGQQADALSYLGSGAVLSMPAYLYTPNPPSASPLLLIPASGVIAVFPFATAVPDYNVNYQLWAGKCRQMEPPAGVDKFTVGPGSSQTAAVQEPALAVFVTSGGLQVKPKDVKISFTALSGPGCPDSWFAPTDPSWTATSVNGVLASPGQPFTNMSSTSGAVSASGFTGQITVCADYTNASGKTYAATSPAMSNANFAAPTPVTLPLTALGTC